MTQGLGRRWRLACMTPSLFDDLRSVCSVLLTGACVAGRGGGGALRCGRLDGGEISFGAGTRKERRHCSHKEATAARTASRPSCLIILGLVADRAGITPAEIAEHLVEVHGEHFAPRMIWCCLDRYKPTSNKAAHVSEQERPDVTAARQTWHASQGTLHPLRLAFVDGRRPGTWCRRRGRRRCA